MRTWDVRMGLWQWERSWNSLNWTSSFYHCLRKGKSSTGVLLLKYRLVNWLCSTYPCTTKTFWNWKTKVATETVKDRQALELCGEGWASMCFTQLWHRCMVGMIMSIQSNFMNPRPALDCRCAPFSEEALCSLLPPDPAPASLLRSFCPTAGVDTAVKY